MKTTDNAAATRTAVSERTPSLTPRRRRGPSAAARRAIGYTRVSLERQAEEGTSLEVQRDRIVSHAVLTGLELTDVAQDRGVSGALPLEERPGLLRVVEAIRAGRADVVIVADRDRFGRDAVEAGYAEGLIRRAGGRLVVLSEMGESVELVAVRQLMAVLEREKTRQRMRTWARSRRDRGLWTGRAPYGYRQEEGRLIPVPEEAAVVDRILMLRARGESLRAIAAVLDADAVPTRTGAAWNPVTVADVVRRAEERRAERVAA